MCTVFHSGFIVNLKRCPWYEKECHFSAYFFCARLSIWSLVFSEICKGSPQRGKVFGHLISNVISPHPEFEPFVPNGRKSLILLLIVCKFTEPLTSFVLLTQKRPDFWMSICGIQPTLTLSCLLGSPLKKNSVLPPFWGYPKGSPISMAKLAKREIVFWP